MDSSRGRILQGFRVGGFRFGKWNQEITNVRTWTLDFGVDLSDGLLLLGQESDAIRGAAVKKPEEPGQGIGRHVVETVNSTR